ncbi:LysR family transcriptional regulator [Kitasatospora indigofera]|uniref:LysR family transcriptional regulator n=1 Tax=Kitasatospora indigofera TaxID=67307 RepID=UPI0036612281
MHLELRHLRILQAVSEHGSLTRAAAALGISQPTLTKQVQRIEEELGAPVFLRGRQGAQPTEFGSFVLARTKAVLTNIEEILAYRPHRGELGNVRFGGTMPSWVGGVLDWLESLDAATGVTVRAERTIGTDVDMVVGRRLDLAIVADYPGHLLEPRPELVYRTVAVEPVFIALCTDHPLAAQEEVRLQDLADEIWVVPHSDGLGWPEHLHDACAAVGFYPNARYRLFDTALRRELVATGRAVAACQASLRADENIAVRPISGNPLWMRHLMLWHRDGAIAGYSDDLIRVAQEAQHASIEASPAYSAWALHYGESPSEAELFHSP